MDLVALFYELKNLGMALWIDNGRLCYQKYAISDAENKLLDQLLVKIRSHRSQIIELLEIHFCYTAKKFKETIFHIQANRSCLSLVQERLWFIHKYENGTNAYNIPFGLRLAQDINLTQLKASFKQIILKHEVLRTVIEEDDESNCYQIVLKEEDYRLLIDMPIIVVKNKQELENKIEQEIHYVFNLTNEIPIKINFYQLDESKELYIIITIHHIAFDGGSIDLFLNELCKIYNSTRSTAGANLYKEIDKSQQRIQYKDFALWQKYYLNDHKMNLQLEYWKTKLDGYEPLNLISNKGRPQRLTYVGENVPFLLNDITSQKLRLLAANCKVSLFSVLLGAYALMLKVYSNQNDLVIGVPISGRNHQHLQDVIGMFVNTLALRININQTMNIHEFIQDMSNLVQDGYTNQDIPFNKIIENLNIPKDVSRHPIFQAMLVLQHFEQSNMSNELFSFYDISNLYKIAKFDFTIFIDDSDQILKGIFNYRSDLFDRATILNFIKTYSIILDQFAYAHGNLALPIGNIHFTDSLEYDKLVYTWNNTSNNYDLNKSISLLFEEQVMRTPDRIAISFRDLDLTYYELNVQVNKLAYYLLDTYSIKPEDLIVIYQERSEMVLIAILAILRIGAAYVPIDTNYSDNRIKFIINDTNARLIITNDKFKEQLISTCSNVDDIIIVEINKVLEYSQHHVTTNPSITFKTNHLAYVIYTSGTTGNPKGVMIEHANLINYFYNVRDKIYNIPSQIVDYSTNISFDLTITTTLCALLAGYHVSIYDGDVLDINAYVNHLYKHKVNIIKLVPSYFELLVESLPLCTNCVILGGEKLSNKLLAKIKDRELLIYDEYGPTEATVGSCLAKLKINSKYDFSSSNNIGMPYDNYTCYILDKNLNILPINAVGELYIGGQGLARGYLNLPNLTQTTFISNPFQTKNDSSLDLNKKLYRTGDLVRRLPDGNLEYIGRIDSQVKLRGYRIELAEIEHHLNNYPSIKQSIVTIKTNHQESSGSLNEHQILAGYFVAAKTLNKQDILSYLRKLIPEYMIPQALVQLENIPLTANGKSDYTKLPYPKLDNSNSYIAPTTEIEKKLCNIWAELLGIPVAQISIRDNFFNLGGNSILAIKLASKINKELNLAISIVSLFIYHSIEQILQFVNTNSVNIVNNNSWEF